MDIPAPPPALKVISPYLKLAKEYDKRDAVVAYYCEYRIDSIVLYYYKMFKSPELDFGGGGGLIVFFI